MVALVVCLQETMLDGCAVVAEMLHAEVSTLVGSRVAEVVVSGSHCWISPFASLIAATAYAIAYTPCLSGGRVSPYRKPLRIVIINDVVGFVSSRTVARDILCWSSLYVDGII